MPEQQLYSIGDLHLSGSASDLIDSHSSVVRYYGPSNDNRELFYDFEMGVHWSPEEMALLDRKKKAAVIVNRIKPAERIFLGTLINSRYAIKPAPTEPGDQDLSDIITGRYHWHAHTAGIRYKDPQMHKEAYIGGNAWQESYMQVTPGKKPRLVVMNQNNFAIFPDPDRRDLIENSDCRFIDRESWMSKEEMCEAVPEKAEMIMTALQNYHNEDGQKFEKKSKTYADRSHEWYDEKHGKYKVVERFYRVNRKWWYGVNAESGEELEIGEGAEATPEIRRGFQEDHPEHQMQYEENEFLYLALVCSPVSREEYLINEPYHCQPRDPVSGRIMFTLQELFYEELYGETSGNVEHQVGMNKVVNSMFTNKLHFSKHATSTNLIRRAEAFSDDETADFDEHFSDGDRVFETKIGVDPGTAVSLIPQGSTNPDTDESMRIANGYQDELSSTTPAMKGYSEGNVPASLNKQRIQQSETQLAPFVLHLKNFMERRAKLWYAYDRFYFTEEETFRVIEKPESNGPDWMTMNQTVVDEYGRLSKVNDISTAAYDIVFEDSWESPTMRDKVREQITAFQANTSVQQDPVLNAMLGDWFVKLSDAPQKLKDEFSDHSSILSKWELEKKMMDQQKSKMEQMQQVQTFAQTEAEQTQAGFERQGAQGQNQPVLQEEFNRAASA